MPMNPLLRATYGAVAGFARLLTDVAPESDTKFWRSFRARRGLVERYAEWARAQRDASRRLLWMHAPSVGEGLQARPVLELARAERPDLQLAYTFFSPSAEKLARGLAVDFADYLPFDSLAEMRAAIEALRPSALVFAKLDLWPMLSEEAARRGVRLGMISATLAAGSSRRNAIAASLLRGAYARLELVGAIDAGDAERLAGLGVRREAIRVTGDTRYDQVWARARAADSSSALLGPLASERPTLVAGSTWPADEAPLLAAWNAVRRQVPAARLIVAPHEPTPAHLTPIERWAGAHRLSLARFGAPGASTADVVLVDRVGVLGDLYALADAAFVGGGFHSAGLHSVLEPAAFGAPVLFGPRHENSRDAGLLVAAGGGASVADGEALASRLVEWLGDGGAGRAAGERAKRLVEDGLGAARRSWELVLELLR
jgi:3-deoxy-D-manno-octulosonic-acid transferase